MKDLKSELRTSNRMALAEGTRKNLKIQWESFLLFCLFFNLAFLPASTSTLQLYAQFLSRSFKAVASIRNYLSGIRTVHLMSGFQLEDVNKYLINISLRGIARLKKHTVRQAEPITPELLYRMYFVLNMENNDDVVFWCLFLFAFFLVARKSNLVPTTKGDIINNRCLFRRDVTKCDDNLVVVMNWSKVIQFGERQLKTPLLRLPGSILCPVRAYEKMIKTIKASLDDPLFLFSNKKPVTYYYFQKKLRSVIESLGLDSSIYSSHSFRRGFATFAFRQQVSADEIQILGDWRSDVYKRYISMSIQDKLNIVSNLKDNFYF